MVVRNLDQYLRENNLVHTAPLSCLSNTRLGVDAITYLRKCVANPATVEPFTPAATGGVPLTLTAQIEKDLKLLEKYRIKPVFVFNGIRPAMERPFSTESRNPSGLGKNPTTGMPSPGPTSSPSFRGQQPAAPNSPQPPHMPPPNPHALPSSSEIEKASIRSRAWMAYEQAHTQEAEQLFASTVTPLSALTSPPTHPPGDIATSFQADLLRLVHRTFKHRTVEFIVAPYLAMAQLIYLERHPKQYVHSVWGSDELLMFELGSLGNGIKELVLGGTNKSGGGHLWDRIVIDVEFSPPAASEGAAAPEPYFKWVSKSEILQHLSLSADQFLDLAILAGFEYAPTFPPLISFHQPAQYPGNPQQPQPSTPIFSYKAAIDLLRQHGNGLRALQYAFPATENYHTLPHPYANRQAYQDLFLRSRLLIKYALVFTSPLTFPSEKGVSSTLPTTYPLAPNTYVLPLPLALPYTAPPSPPQMPHSPQGRMPPPSPSRPTPTINLPPGAAGNSNSNAALPIPSDLHLLHTPRLPDELYLHLFRGLIAPSLLNALTSGWYKEDVPLDLLGGAGDTDDWRRWVRETCTEKHDSPRCVALGMLVVGMGGGPKGAWAKRPVHAVYHFDPTRDFLIPHTSRETQAVIERITLWNVDARTIEEELRRQTSSTIDLALCLGATSNPGLAHRTKMSKNPSKVLDRKDEVVANTLWRFLELRSFLTSSHTHTPYAKAMYAALRHARINDKFQETIFIALEMIRGNVLHNGRYSGRVWSGGPRFGDENEKRNQLLIMRVVSIIQLEFKTRPEPWSTAPLSRELLVFNSFTRTLTRSLRALVEATVVCVLLKGDARRHREDYLELALSLPFKTDTGTGMGILFKGWGDAVTAMCGGGEIISAAMNGNEECKQKLSEAKAMACDMLENAFDNVRSVKNELTRAIRFWDAVLVAVRTLRDEGAIDKGLANQFEAAESWLKAYRLEDVY